MIRWIVFHSPHITKLYVDPFSDIFIFSDLRPWTPTLVLDSTFWEAGQSYMSGNCGASTDTPPAAARETSNSAGGYPFPVLWGTQRTLTPHREAAMSSHSETPGQECRPSPIVRAAWKPALQKWQRASCWGGFHWSCPPGVSPELWDVPSSPRCFQNSKPAREAPEHPGGSEQVWPWCTSTCRPSSPELHSPLCGHPCSFSKGGGSATTGTFQWLPSTSGTRTSGSWKRSVHVPKTNARPFWQSA